MVHTPLPLSARSRKLGHFKGGRALSRCPVRTSAMFTYSLSGILVVELRVYSLRHL